MFFQVIRLAADEAAAATAEEQAMMQGGGLQQYISMGIALLLFGVVFYFMILRPQKKRDKEFKSLMERLRIGDKVVTIGGIVGRVANIKDDEITIATSVANTLITFQKSAINNVITPESAEPAKPAKKDKKEKKLKVKSEDED